jgi:hypothetical protein
MRAHTKPFPGLRPFTQEEADLFFGRDKQSDELVRRLASKRFLAVVGTNVGSNLFIPVVGPDEMLS